MKEKSWETLLNAENLATKANLKDTDMEIDDVPDKRTIKTVNYIKYVDSKDEILVLLTWLLIGGIVAYAFFESLIMCLIIQMVFYIPVRKAVLDRVLKWKKSKLKSQFMDMLKFMKTALENGYSLENSIKESLIQLELLHGKNARMVREAKWINKRINLNIPITEVWGEWSVRSRLPEAFFFANIIAVVKETGGDIAGITGGVIEINERQIEDERSIDIAVSSKKFEQMILSVVPVFMICYVKVSSKGYMDVMYKTMMGKVCMGICLVVYLFAIGLSLRILDIDVR